MGNRDEIKSMVKAWESKKKGIVPELPELEYVGEEEVISQRWTPPTVKEIFTYAVTVIVILICLFLFFGGFCGY